MILTFIIHLTCQLLAHYIVIPMVTPYDPLNDLTKIGLSLLVAGIMASLQKD